MHFEAKKQLREGETVGGVEQRRGLDGSFIGVWKPIEVPFGFFIMSNEIVRERPL